jgi:hypothetical protein
MTDQKKEVDTSDKNRDSGAGANLSAEDAAVIPGVGGSSGQKPGISQHPVWLFVVLNIVLVLFLIVAGAIAMKSGCIPNRSI